MTNEQLIAIEMKPLEGCAAVLVSFNRPFTHVEMNAMHHALNEHLIPHASEPGVQLPTDKERLDWWEAQHTLHNSLHLLYVVDGYDLEINVDDRTVACYRGEDIRACIDAAMQGASRDASPALYKCTKCDTPMKCGPTQWEYQCGCHASRDASSGDSILDHKVTVCSACLCAGCWQGSFYCEDYKSAKTVEKTVRELAQGNARESADFWFRDENTGKVDEEKLARFHRSQRT